jgi:hypothetical protein
MVLIEDAAAMAAAVSYRALFTRTDTVVGLVVADRAATGRVLARLGHQLYTQRGTRNVVDDGDTRVVLLAPDVVDPAAVTAVEQLPDAVKHALFAPADSSNTHRLGNKKNKSKAVQSQPFQPADFTLKPVDVALTYKNFTMVEMLTRILPAGVVVPSGFEQVGHIAKLNLDKDHLPFKYAIGAVVLDTNAPVVRSVVNKLESLSNEFRELSLELIAGDNDMNGEVKQHVVTFSVPFD